MNNPDAPRPARLDKDLGKRREGRIIAGADVNSHIDPKNTFSPHQHRAVKGSGYIAVQGEPFVRRAIGKVKGKAAKKAAKKARHAARNRIGNAIPPREDL